MINLINFVTHRPFRCLLNEISFILMYTQPRKGYYNISYNDVIIFARVKQSLVLTMKAPAGPGICKGRLCYVRLGISVHDTSYTPV